MKLRCLSFPMLVLVLLLVPHGVSSAAESGDVAWLHSERAAFARARAERRPVLLYLEAVWCHWCHVMDRQTYGDARVAALVARRYVPLRLDQDARPDLAARYRRYGWPATIVFDADGRELAKRRGYVAPDAFRRLLEAIAASPADYRAALEPAPAPPADGRLSTVVRTKLLAAHRLNDDPVRGGLKFEQKFLDRDAVEYSMTRAEDDPQEAAMARRTLGAARALLDPVWGGFYQYSTGGDWAHPHYEKLGVLQAEYLRIYALAYARFGERRDLGTARLVHRYLDRFLRSPQGAWYASQDADLRPGEHAAGYFALDAAGRRALGVPRVDRHLYARENGAIAEALATFAELTGDRSALDDARRSVRWALAHRALPGGGFRHDARDAHGPYLADALAMGRAFLALYRADADARWLRHAGEAAAFIERSFRHPQAGYVGSAGGGPIAPVRQLDENLSLARFANLLARYTGQQAQRAMAEHAFAYLAAPEVALSRFTDIGILLAADELASDPLHLTVIGAREDPNAAALFASVQRLPGWYKRADWWDRARSALPNPDVDYPPVKRAAVFVCTDRVCSLPLYTPAALTEHLQALHEPVD